MARDVVAVVGGGVVGLSIAHELAARGHDVTVVADRSAQESVSAVAAAIWFPYRAGASADLAGWLSRSLHRFGELSLDPATGVDLRPGLVVERRPDPDRSWTDALPHHTEAAAQDLPSGATSGVRVTVPVITTPVYLRWLAGRCAELGVRTVHRSLASVDELHGLADVAVVAAGLRSGELLDDDSVFPVRGQVVRLANPGLTHWVTDEDDPAGITYVIPRREDVVVGGTAETGSWDEGVDREAERAMLSRATALVPALDGLSVLSRAAGLRPARAAVRLERVPGRALPVLACYGHGGAGVTLSWGCAEQVADLVGAPRSDVTDSAYAGAPDES